jgi:glycosyltransferase involved in cell wall biosynthesis
MDKRRVLYISYDGMTDPLGQSQVIPYLRELTKLGYEFHILSAEKEDNFLKNQKHILSVLKDAGIYWHPIKYTKKPPVLSTIIDVRKISRAAILLHKEYKFSICHCRSYISAFAGLKLKNQCGVPFLFDMRGFYPDERVDGGLWKQKNPVFRLVYKYFKRKEKSFFNSANHVISLTETGKEELCSWENLTITETDITVIPCCADLDHFDPSKVTLQQKKEFKKELNINDSDFVISYLGSIGTWYLPNEMLDFFAELLKIKPKSKFLVITRDNPMQLMQAAKMRNIPEDRIIIRPADRDEVPALISISNVSLFFIKPVFSKKASSPTKLAEIIGMGVPVICNGNVGDIDRIVENENVGIVIHEFTVDEYQNTINRLADLQEISPNYLRSVSEKLFSLRVGTYRYHNAYKKIQL